MLVRHIENVDQVVVPEDVLIRTPGMGSLIDEIYKMGGFSRAGLVLGGSFMMGLSMIQSVRGTFGQSVLGGLGAIAIGLGALPYFIDIGAQSSKEAM